MATWRAAREDDDDALVRMFGAFNREDPGQRPVDPSQMRRTLAVLRAEPHRGRAVVLDIDDEPAGYALLIPFWSNEYGGNCCSIDELFVVESHRSGGHGSALLTALAGGSPLWEGEVVALCLEVTPKNERALALYRRLGFRGENVTLSLSVQRR